MSNNFDEVMSKRTDADLIKILNGPPDDYQPAAFESANRELDRRNLSEERITTAMQVIAHKQQIYEAKENEPLSIIMKIGAFLIPGLFAFMYAGTYKADGFGRKGRELINWTAYGFAFYFSIIVIVKIVDYLMSK